MNTLDEAITHCKEKAEENRQKAGFETDNLRYMMSDDERSDCLECAKEHEQLAGWLEELQELRSFAEFVTREVLDEDFEEGSGAFAELTCRKLVKLGYVVLDGDTYKRGNENDNFET